MNKNDNQSRVNIITEKLMLEVNRSKYKRFYTNAYGTYQFLYDIRNFTKKVTNEDLDYVLKKLEPPYQVLEAAIKEAEGQPIQNTELIDLFTKMHPIISECRSYLHNAEQKETEKRREQREMEAIESIEQTNKLMSLLESQCTPCKWANAKKWWGIIWKFIVALGVIIGIISGVLTALEIISKSNNIFNL